MGYCFGSPSRLIHVPNNSHIRRRVVALSRIYQRYLNAVQDEDKVTAEYLHCSRHHRAP